MTLVQRYDIIKKRSAQQFTIHNHWHERENAVIAKNTFLVQGGGRDPNSKDHITLRRINPCSTIQKITQ